MTVGLLTPVPEEHLLSGSVVCEREGKIAFGSRAWQVFRELDEILNGDTCECLIYASDQAIIAKEPKVTWRGTYVGHVESRNGAHPDGMKFRPPTTACYPSDNTGHWAVFWHLSDLARLAKEDQIKINTLRGYGKPNFYNKSFRPEGPLLIERM